MQRPVIELGLVMAGAVSAGAYTAGVLDLLLEALAAYEAAKEKAGPALPVHDVRLRAASGTSAGGINAALLATALEGAAEPMREPAKPGRAVRNPFYSAWVDAVDIGALLGTRDLERGRVGALLDSTCLETIADQVLAFPGGAPRPGFVADSLDLFITLTNLRGVPYDIELIGSQIRPNQPAGYEMIAHADHIRFTAGVSRGGEAHALAARDGAGWRLLREAALASAAFPGWLEARRLSRPASDYAARGPMPAWSLSGDRMVELLCVDGGVLNNEPFELTRRVIETEGAGEAHAVILIDPFPRIGEFDPEARLPGGLVGLMPRLVGALRAQASFKPEELAEALAQGPHTRFLIAPRRTDADGTLLPHPLAGGGLEGFAGFLDRGFRLHDFMLGRRNAQRFLARHFALPSDHPAVAQWTRAMDEAHGIWPKGVARTFPAPLRPIVPLVGAAALECAAPDWPLIEAKALKRIERLAKTRLAAVMRGLAADYLGTSFMGRIAPLIIALQRGRAARAAASYIRRTLEARAQIAPRGKRKPAVPKPVSAPASVQTASMRARLLPKLTGRRRAEPVQTIGWGRSIDGMDEPDIVP